MIRRVKIPHVLNLNQIRIVHIMSNLEHVPENLFKKCIIATVSTSATRIPVNNVLR